MRWERVKEREKMKERKGKERKKIFKNGDVDYQCSHLVNIWNGINPGLDYDVPSASIDNEMEKNQKIQNYIVFQRYLFSVTEPVITIKFYFSHPSLLFQARNQGHYQVVVLHVR